MKSKKNVTFLLVLTMILWTIGAQVAFASNGLGHFETTGEFMGNGEGNGHIVRGVGTGNGQGNGYGYGHGEAEVPH
ncbi:hypothetical protein SDC9_170886 [bioreactor metagenome]|uniref:Uncharacterized protein n=1 Tax=bioreactor metagenome TaxID=1076179 RepID=A0A645G9C3_9ZZZZ